MTWEQRLRAGLLYKFNDKYRVQTAGTGCVRFNNYCSLPQGRMTSDDAQVALLNAERKYMYMDI